jgi:hypothetical protein
MVPENSYCLQSPLNAGRSVWREDWSAPENRSAESPLAQQLMKWEQEPTPPPQSASDAHGAVPQLHLQVLRTPVEGGTSAGTEKALFNERSGMMYV